MPLTTEQRHLIIKEFIEAFQQKYGEDWIYHLSQNLRPSPIRHIAQKYNVKISHVRQIRQQFIAIGNLFLLQAMLIQPINSQIQVEEWSWP